MASLDNRHLGQHLGKKGCPTTHCFPPRFALKDRGARQQLLLHCRRELSAT